MPLTADDLNAIRDLIRDETEPLRAELERVDDWANGIFVALQEALIPLLMTHPELAEHLAPVWRAAEERYDRSAHGQAEDIDEPLERLDPRKMLYRQLAQLGVWPGVDAAKARQQTLVRAGLPVRGK